MTIDPVVARKTWRSAEPIHAAVYFAEEQAEVYGRLGLVGREGYFASRSAAMGPVGPEVVIATFYNFSPQAVRAGCAGVWQAATPDALQAARFRVVRRALDRVGVELSEAEVEEARALIDPVVADLDLAGKPLGAANAAVALPADPLVALWQQVTVLREWRGDVHIALLVANEIGPCDCMVLQVGTGRFPLSVTKATRQWDDEAWAAAVARLGARGWVDPDGAMTEAGMAERERIETDTDRLCAPIWTPVGDQGARRLTELLAPINVAMEAAGTYAALK